MGFRYWMRKLYEDEGGFLQWLIPLLLTGIQYLRQGDAQRTIDQAEQSKIPGETSQIRESLSLRGLGNTSAAANQIGQPAEDYALRKRVRGANEILSSDSGNPLSSALQLYQYLQSIKSKQGDTGGDPIYSVPQPGTPVPRVARRTTSNYFG